jgi:hypothetical protein
LKFLPKAGVVGELGVLEGGFSRQIMKVSCPQEFHLIDVWDACPNPYPSKEKQEKNYRGVLAMFDKEINAGSIIVHRGDGIEYLKTLPHEYFDWLYIDTTHQYEQTLRELELAAQKVKPDGYICGHDYTDNYVSRRWGFGVLRAVTAFVRNSDWQYSCLTTEPFSSYVLSRKST